MQIFYNVQARLCGYIAYVRTGIHVVGCQNGLNLGYLNTSNGVCSLGTDSISTIRSHGLGSEIFKIIKEIHTKHHYLLLCTYRLYMHGVCRRLQANMSKLGILVN